IGSAAPELVSIGRRARLRIAKSSISQRRSSLQFITTFTREKRLFRAKCPCARRTSRTPFLLAQILAHGRPRSFPSRRFYTKERHARQQPRSRVSITHNAAATGSTDGKKELSRCP